MNAVNAGAWRRYLSATGLALLVWLAGFLVMALPLGDPLLRLSYDYLHLLTSHPPVKEVLVIAMNEATERKLNVKRGEPFSRRLHGQLLQRLKQAGAEWICYDILFDLPSSDPQADESFRGAIEAHGRVILGGVEQATRRDAILRQDEVIKPIPALLAAAGNKWALLNAATPDPDGVVRRFTARTGSHLALATIAAQADVPQMEIPAGVLWLYYQARPGEITTQEFADCLDPKVVPEDKLHGKTVFIGGQYASDGKGRADFFPTPYSRFGAPPIPGVTLHATAFACLRDGAWFETAGQVRNAFWCVPFALLSSLLFYRRGKTWLVIIGWMVLAIILAVGSVFSIWNDRVLVNWVVPGLVQLPLCLLASVVQKLAALRPRTRQNADRVQILLSAVSAEFKSYRETLHKVLNRPNVDVKVQEDFISTGGGTLEKLDDYILACDAVIHLAGEMTGSFAEEPAVAGLKRRYPDLAKRLPVLRDSLTYGTPLLSYTQWEAYLAVYHDKILVIAAPTPGAERDPKFAPDDKQRDLQDAHIKRLFALGYNREIYFSSADKLSIEVLRSKLHDILARVAASV